MSGIYDKTNIEKRFVYTEKSKGQRWAEESKRLRDRAFIESAKSIKKHSSKKKKVGLNYKLPKLRYW